MNESRDFTGARSIAVDLFTRSTRSSGELRHVQPRFSDAMNAANQDFLVLFNGAVQSLDAPKEEAVSVASLLFRREHIILAAPRETRAGTERSPAQQALQLPRKQVPVQIEAWPVSIAGVLHLPAEMDLIQCVHDLHRGFMPVTNASVTYRPTPLVSFKSPFLMVNRSRIEVVLEEARIGQRAEQDPDVAQPQVEDLSLSGVRAAELLSASEMLKDVDSHLLQELTGGLCEAGALTRKAYRAGTQVFCQGDVGDTLYLVETGKLDVYERDPGLEQERTLGSLGPGDILGEKAVMGVGRRTATVQVVEDSILLAIHKEAVEALIDRFPTVTTNLTRLMLLRPGLSERSDDLPLRTGPQSPSALSLRTGPQFPPAPSLRNVGLASARGALSAAAAGR